MLPQSQDDALAMTRYILAMANLNDLPLTIKARTQNWVFDTVMPDGEKAVIRLRPIAFPPTQRTMEGLEKSAHAQSLMAALDAPYLEHTTPYSSCEAYMLRTLSTKTDLKIPRLIQLIGYGASELAIFSYVQGESRTPQTLTLREAALCGGFLAQLHAETRRLIFRSVTDRLITAEGLLGRSSHYASHNEGEFLSQSDLATLARLRQRLADVETLIGTESEHTLLLHGDFLLQNIVFEDETVGALDFEMCGWGTDLYDLATFLWMLKPQPHYERLADALWQGYTFWRELPPREWMEIFIAARQGASVRWLIQNRHLPAYADRVPALIRQRMDEIAAFLETGVLKRQ